MAKERVAWMYGGRSLEHEVSVISALQALRALDTAKYTVIPIYLALNGKWYTGDALLEQSFYRKLPDAYSQLEEVTLLPDSTIGGFTRLPSGEAISVDSCFLSFHGQYGEDGSLQGLLELADIPYTGCGVFSSAAAMNKYHCKAIVKTHGISTLPAVLVSKREALSNIHHAVDKVVEKLDFPLFVKPNHLGSSIGIAKAEDQQELVAAFAKVFQYDDQAVVEPLLDKLLEINVSVLEGDPPMVSVIEIPVAKGGALSYEDKYLRGGGKVTGGRSEGMAGLSRVIDPSDIDPDLKARALNDAVEIFQVLECGGVCRLDFMLDVNTGILYFNELNPIPGSFAFYLWDKSTPQILFTDLIEALLEGAKRRKSIQLSLKKEFGFHAL